jgi:hypothetical protein
VKNKTKTLAFANLIGSILFLALGIWAWFQAGGFQEVKGSYVQPSTFPKIMIVGLMIFSVILLIQSLWKLNRMKESDPLAVPAESINFIKEKSVAAGLLVIVLCVLFVALFQPLGYVLSSFLLSMVIMYLIGKRNWVQMVLVSLVVPLVMWAIFYKLLAVNIPMGPLTFLRTLADMI